MAELSLCMIVRDEAEHLEGCLESVAGLCDEVIVVDTGSTDDTVQIARRLGARISTFPWCDDFAAARNASIEQATGRWLLILDADERLGPDAAQSIREVIQADEIDCGLLWIHDAATLEAAAHDVLDGSARLHAPMRVARLLRNEGQPRFTGIVHETIRSWVVSGDRRMHPVNADIVHYGAVPQLREHRQKSRRNITLLERRLELEPDDFTVHGYLAHEYLVDGDKDQAWMTVERGWPLVENASKGSLRSALRLTAVRVGLQLERGEPAHVLETLKVARRYEGAHPDFDYFSGQAHEMLAAHATSGAERTSFLRRAEADYRTSFRWQGKQVAHRTLRDTGVWTLHTRLGSTLLKLGRPGEARDEFERALEFRAEDPAAICGLAEALIETDAASEALDVLRTGGVPTRDLTRPPSSELLDTPDPWIVLACCFDALGDLHQSAAALEHARHRMDRGLLDPFRTHRYRTLLVQRLCYLGRSTEGHGSMETLARILAGSTTLGVPTLIEASERRTLCTTLHNLIRNGHAARLERLLTPEAERQLPGVTALLGHVTQRLAAV